MIETRTVGLTRGFTRSLVALTAVLSVAACGGSDSSGWAGTIDTLATGQVVVHNPATPMWSEEAAWRLTPDLRIGTMEGDGPDLFGQITSLAVDGAGRIYVLDGQAQEVRVFGPDGAHIRTFGRKGAGPGELARALRIEFGPDGNLWVADPENNRVSVFDTTGRYVKGPSMAGGFVIMPWPGRFDRHGSYYYPVPLPSEEEFGIGLIRYDSTVTPVDTLEVPKDPVDREYFEMRRDQSVAISSVPYTGSFRWQLAPDGTFWGYLTGPYRMFDVTPDGDTLRTVTREFTPLPVTDEDMDQARENMKWFLDMGGEVDWSKIPSHKPGMDYALVDAQGYIWVWPVMPLGEEGTVLDVFDPEGRYLGRIHSPVPIATRPDPVIYDNVMYAVTESDLDVPYVIRLHIDKPGAVRGE